MPLKKGRTRGMVLTLLVLFWSFATPKLYVTAQEERFTTGIWWGTFVFTFNHTFDAPSPENGILYNNYELESEKAIGSLAFTVGKKGNITWSIVRFPRIKYHAVIQLLNNWDVPCRGYTAFGGGVARIDTETSVVLQRTTNTGLFTSPISIYGGIPYVKFNGVGNCDRTQYVPALRDSITYDLAAMIETPWAFQADSILDNKISGTCSTETWTTIDRSMVCTWQAFLSK